MSDEKKTFPQMIARHVPSDYMALDYANAILKHGGKVVSITDAGVTGDNGYEEYTGRFRIWGILHEDMFDEIDREWAWMQTTRKPLTK